VTEATGRKRPRVVVVGGGFGGLACVKKLARDPVDVVLVDTRDYHLFTPLLYQVATALLNPADIVYPFRAILRRLPNVRFYQASIVRVDLERRILTTGRGRELAYDYLVLATGSTSDYFGNDDLRERTLAMKTLEQAQRLRNHLLACLEHAAQSEDDAERRRWLTFVIAGGGATGVEYAGAVSEFRKLVAREYPELSDDLIRIVVVEGTDRLLPAFPPKLGRYARKALHRLGVEVKTGALLVRIQPGVAELSSGETLATETVVWSAGVRANSPDEFQHVGRGKAARLEVDDRLRVAGRPEVMAIGDLAAAEGPAGGLPMLSAPAMQQGRYSAEAIRADIRGKPGLPPFKYRDKGTMAVIGRNHAVASFAGLQLTGFVAWTAWLTVHLYYLVGFRNRAAVFLTWAWDYLNRDHPTRMITTVERDPVAEQLAAPPAT
jgi:NADH:ubiquinone reductase (H+-translocating)